MILESDLREIVRQELKSILNEVNPYHNKDGYFSSKEDAKSYSLTDKSKIKDRDKIKKGKVSNGNISYRFGLTKCGRRDIRGDDIQPTVSCGGFPKSYYSPVKTEGIEVGLGKEVGSVDIQDAVVLSNKYNDKTICFQLNDIIDIIQRTSKNKQDLAEDSSQNVMSYCNRNYYYTLDQFLRLLSNIEDSKSGKYPKRKEDKD